MTKNDPYKQGNYETVEVVKDILTTCMDCGCDKESTHLTGSRQCPSCHKKLVTRLREIAPSKFIGKSQRQVIRELYDKNKDAVQITEKTKIKISYVREVISRYKRDLSK